MPPTPILPDIADRTRGTCSYYPSDARGCRAPRSCYDCLNTEIEKEPGGCMINDIGRCISVADLSLDLVAAVAADGKAGGSSNKSSMNNVSEKTQPLPGTGTSQPTFEIQFTAENTTYCEDDDVLFNKDQLADVGYSYGIQGCVFVLVCEVPSWKSAVGGSNCSDVNPVDVEDSNDSNPRDYKGYSMFWSVAIPILLMLVVTLVMTIIHHNRSKRRFEERQRQRIVVITELIASSSQTMAPQFSKSGTRPLNLFGWEAMRIKLIENERCKTQERLCGLVSEH